LHELFIYYRVRAAQANEARSAVLRWQRELSAVNASLCSRLLMRPDEHGGMQTWMETYAMSGSGDAVHFHQALRERIERGPSELQPFLIGARHLEVFVPCAC
jgi:hypothetical protein